ncbi:MAG: PDZ domain-containing protein [Chloroflexi bacterium]|nr:PDZ domain-containing protein [Chloroflexota bacterium]
MSELITQLSEGLADAVSAVSPSILRVEGRRRLPASGIAWSTDGVVVTSHHVVQRNENIMVGLANGDTVAATVVGRDPTTDLAVLRTDTELTPPNWLESENLRVGRLVLALGRPRTDVQSTLGVISALGGAWRTGAGGKIDPYLQTDVLMYPGFSGGALVDVGGGVIGLNSSALARGVSVSIPILTLRRIVNALLEHGHVRRGYLGVGVQTAQLPKALAHSLDQKTGVLVISVDAGSTAEEGGLLLGDTIITLDQNPVRRVDDLQAHLSGDRVGKSVSVRIIRGGEVQALAVVVGERK